MAPRKPSVKGNLPSPLARARSLAATLRLTRRWVLTLLACTIAADSAAALSVYGPDERGARRLCVRTISLHDLVGSPGVRLRLQREREVIEGTSTEWPPCDSGADRCGLWDVRTGARNEACFDSVPPGDYFVSAQQEDYWPTRTGPMRVPSYEFERVWLGIGLDLVWSYRYEQFMVVDGGGPQSGDAGRHSPYESPEAPNSRPGAGHAREVCIAVWKLSEPEEPQELPRTRVTLEPREGSSSRPELTPSDETRAAPTGAWTGERGVACFPGVSPGRYLARATYQGFWEAAVGPIEVPVEDFDVRDVRVGLDLQWAGDVIINLCEGFTWP